jgi:predicted SnoaL-like aldol condensation-catalyzing enzyme
VEPSKVVAIYGAAWNEPDEAKRTALLEESWVDDGVYQDPTGVADGRAALVAHIGEFHEMFPGRSIDFASGVDVTDAGIRWAWVMRNGDAIELEGMDFAELAPDGRIRRIAGFFGPLPSLDA